MTRDGWTEKSVSELGKVYSGATPSTSITQFWDGDIVWVTPIDFNNGQRAITESQRTITREGLKSCSTQLLPSGTLIMSSRAPIGYLTISGVEFTTNQGCKSIVFNLNQDVNFHFYNIGFYIKRVHDKGDGTTFAEISKKSLENIKFPVPEDINVQQKIAQILSTIDQALEQTQALIAKYQRMKTGLMQDLLTRGIDEQGQLRHPDTKQEQRPLKDFIKIYHGYAFSGKYFSDVNNEKILLTPGNFLSNGNLYFEKSNTKFYSGEIPDGFLLETRTLVTVMTDLTKEMNILGSTAIIPINRIILHNQRIGKIEIFNENELLKDYLLVCLNSPIFREQIKITATGTTVRHTSPQRILEANIPIPKMAEQLEIVQIFRNCDAKNMKYKQQKQKLELIKSGLMQDLLSGHRSVTALLEDTIIS